jgi:hypothetical protein
MTRAATVHVAIRDHPAVARALPDHPTDRAPVDAPKEVAVRAGHTPVSVVLDRYGHLLPGTEERVNEALDAVANAAARSPRVATVAALR